MAEPDFDIDHPNYDHLTPLQMAIQWDSIECFNFLMINGADRSEAMIIAISCGRREMIELLEQDGQGFEDGFETACATYENEIAKWLLDTGRVTDLNQEMINIVGTKNTAVIDYVLSHMEPPQSYPSWIQNNLTSLSEYKILNITRENPSDLSQCMSRMTQDQCQGFFMGCLERTPFDDSLLSDNIISQITRPIYLSVASTIEAIQFCKTRIPKQLLHSRIVQPVLLQAIKNGVLLFEDFDWSLAALAFERLTTLYEAGASLSQRFPCGNTILHRLINFHCDIEAIQFALDHGADPFARNKSGHSAIFLARSCPFDIIDLFPTDPSDQVNVPE